MSEELAVLKDINAVEVFVAGGTDKLLQAIRDEVINIVPDLTTAKGRKEIASRAANVGKSKVFIIKKADVLKAELKAQLKPITLETTKVTNTLDALRKEVRLPLTQWEDEEAARVNDLKAKLYALEFNLNFYGGFSISDLSSHLEQYKDITLNKETFGEFLTEAEIAKPIFIEKLSAHLAEMVKAEEEAAELERLQKAEADRKQKEREEQIAKDAAAKAEAAQAKAEADKKAAEEQARANKIHADAAIKEAEAREKKGIEDAKARLKAAEDKAIEDQKAAEIKAEADKEAAIEYERKRVAAELVAAEKEAKKKAANKEHRKIINLAALAGLNLLPGVDEDLAKSIITAIAKGKIKNITINY